MTRERENIYHRRREQEGTRDREKERGNKKTHYNSPCQRIREWVEGKGEVIADSIVMCMCGVRGLVGSTCGKKRGKKKPVRGRGRGGGNLTSDFDYETTYYYDY